MNTNKNKKPTKTRVMSKVIDGYFHTNGDDSITRNVMLANSFDEYVLNLQEMYPQKKITRKSVVKWEFMTREKFNELKASKDYLEYQKEKSNLLL